MQWKGGGVEPPLPNFQKEVGRLGQYISFSREFAGKKWVTIFRWWWGGFGEDFDCYLFSDNVE